jgi:Zn ribbon nucleic-acid-binding protein
MEPSQLIIVPQISSVPGHQALAGRMLRWLAHRRVVDTLPSTCGWRGNCMAYAIGPGARQVVEQPQRLPFGQRVNGLELVDKRCIYTPTRNFLSEAGCPHCRQEVGAPLFDSLEDWWPGHTDNFSCPECGYEDDINGFLFLQPCGFSNLGFIFNGWGETAFTQAFLDAFGERLGFAVRQVRTDG